MSGALDAIDRRIVNALQDGFPLCPRPFAEAAAAIGIDEAELILRLRALREAGILTRFGPMFDAERLGGAFCLAAMAVPRDEFDAVAALVNAHREVAHNYERDHALNMWFVLATETPEGIGEALAAIERETGLAVLAMPRLESFGLELRLAA